MGACTRCDRGGVDSFPTHERYGVDTNWIRIWRGVGGCTQFDRSRVDSFWTNGQNGVGLMTSLHCTIDSLLSVSIGGFVMDNCGARILSVDCGFSK